MKILVTGGAGFLGSHLVDFLSTHGHDVVVLDDFSTGKIENVNMRASFHCASIADYASCVEAVRGCDAIYHFAAKTSVQETVAHPERALEINELGTINILRAGVQAGISSFVFISSAAVYGDPQTFPVCEDFCPNPLSPYGQTKLAGEFYTKFYAEKAHFRYYILRLFNAYGQRQREDSAYAAVIPSFAKRALAGDAITIFGDGQQTRDFVHASDVVRAITHLTASNAPNGVYNLGGASEISIYNLAKKVIEIAKSNSEIVFASARANDIYRSLACINKIKATGYEHKQTLDAGLCDTLKSYST